MGRCPLSAANHGCVVQWCLLGLAGASGQLRMAALASRVATNRSMPGRMKKQLLARKSTWVGGASGRADRA